MNKYPTIFITFKDINGLNFDTAYRALTYNVTSLFNEFDFLLDSKNIKEDDRNNFLALKSGNFDKTILKNIKQNYKNFNIGISTSTRGDFSNNWKDPYRHWCFKSKNSVFDSSLTKNRK